MGKTRELPSLSDTDALVDAIEVRVPVSQGYELYNALLRQKEEAYRARP